MVNFFRVGGRRRAIAADTAIIYKSSCLQIPPCLPRSKNPTSTPGEVKTTLSRTNIRGIGERLTGIRPVDTRAIQDLALKLGAQQPDVQWEHIEASI